MVKLTHVSNALTSIHGKAGFKRKHPRVGSHEFRLLGPRHGKQKIVERVAKIWIVP